MCTCPTQRRPPLPPSRPPHPSKSEAVTTSTHVISTKFLRICRFLSCLQLAFPRRCHLANRPSSLPTPGPAAHKCRHHHHQHVYCPGRYYPSILTTSIGSTAFASSASISNAFSGRAAPPFLMTGLPGVFVQCPRFSAGLRCCSLPRPVGCQVFLFALASPRVCVAPPFLGHWVPSWFVSPRFSAGLRCRSVSRPGPSYPQALVFFGSSSAVGLRFCSLILAFRPSLIRRSHALPVVLRRFRFYLPCSGLKFSSGRIYLSNVVYFVPRSSNCARFPVALHRDLVYVAPRSPPAP